MAVTSGTMMAISSGLTVVGQLAQGRAHKQAGSVESAQAEIIAGQQEDQAQQEADRIRRAGTRVRGAARAQMAANGIMVDSGSAVVVDDEIAHDSEKDAMNTLLTGKRQADATRFSGDQAKKRGEYAEKASVLGALTTGLQGWKGVKQAQPEYRYQVPTYDGAEY